MGFDARGLEYTGITAGRVKYDMEYDSDNDLYRLPKAPELIIACENAAVGIFYTAASDYEPVWFDSSVLNGIYGDQIFFDVTGNKNFIVLSESISDPCLTTMTNFTNN